MTGRLQQPVSAQRSGIHNGGMAGIWGAMSDFSRTFRPWEEGFSKGLYLAGVECEDEAHNRQPPPIGNPRHPTESWHPRTG